MENWKRTRFSELVQTRSLFGVSKFIEKFKFFINSFLFQNIDGKLNGAKITDLLADATMEKLKDMMLIRKSSTFSKF